MAASDIEHWYQPVAEFLGPAYLRNAFATGTAQEVAFLVDTLGLAAGDHVLDAGCGPGRHSLELRVRGIRVTGVDVSPAFVDLARQGGGDAGLDDLVTFRLGDLRLLDDEEAYDALICLCQGGFGLLGGGPEGEAADLDVLRRFRRALRPGAPVALTAFSAYFALSGLYDGDHRFDAEDGRFHEVAELRNEAGETKRMPMATSCYTPRELRLLCALAGLDVDAVHGVNPGAYSASPPTTDVAEFLLLAHRPG